MTPNAFPDGWPRVWRGESSGVLFDTFDAARTHHGVGFFFAQSHEHACFYAGHGTQPRAFALDPGRTLNLLDPYRVMRDPGVAAVLGALKEGFDEWVCRHSGEERDVLDYLEAGDLYDYEGTGSGRRWNALFALAQEAGFDSVCVRDNTDGVPGEESVVWVVFKPEQIHPDPERATPGVPLRRGFRP